MARQKIFNLTKPSLIQTFHQGVYPSQHLKALICQLPYVPKFTLANEISNLLPLLMNGLQEANQDDVLTLASLTCLQVKKTCLKKCRIGLPIITGCFSGEDPIGTKPGDESILVLIYAPD